MHFYCISIVDLRKVILFYIGCHFVIVAEFSKADVLCKEGLVLVRAVTLFRWLCHHCRATQHLQGQSIGVLVKWTGKWAQVWSSYGLAVGWLWATRWKSNSPWPSRVTRGPKSNALGLALKHCEASASGQRGYRRFWPFVCVPLDWQSLGRPLEYQSNVTNSSYFFFFFFYCFLFLDLGFSLLFLWLPFLHYKFSFFFPSFSSEAVF